MELHRIILRPQQLIESSASLPLAENLNCAVSLSLSTKYTNKHAFADRWLMTNYEAFLKRQAPALYLQHNNKTIFNIQFALKCMFHHESLCSLSLLQSSMTGYLFFAINIIQQNELKLCLRLHPDIFGRNSCTIIILSA